MSHWMHKKSYGLLLAGLLLLLNACRAAQGTPPIVETGVDASAWATIPAGDFLAGQHNEATKLDHSFAIMVTDVTNAQYAAYLNQALAAGSVKVVGDQVVGAYAGDPYHGVKHEQEIKAGDWLHIPLKEAMLRLNYDGATFSVKAGYENHPMSMVTWFGAKAFCDANGWRLPTELEWEKAARGEDGRAYPWGSEIALNQANYYSSHDLFEKIAGLGDTTPVGFFNGQTYDGYQTADSASPYGLYDMAGNVWQWTADIYEGQHYRYLRGGSKADYEYNLRSFTRNSAGPDYYSPNVGFRCARDK